MKEGKKEVSGNDLKKKIGGRNTHSRQSKLKKKYL